MADGTDEKRAPHSPEEKQALGLHLARARKAAGFTQERAADALHLVKQTVNSWEKGRNVPDALWLRRLSALYEKSTDEMVGNAPAAKWPFSKELVAKVSSLDEPEIRSLEVAMWVHLREEIPASLLSRDADENQWSTADDALAQKVLKESRDLGKVGYQQKKRSQSER